MHSDGSQKSPVVWPLVYQSAFYPRIRVAKRARIWLKARHTNCVMQQYRFDHDMPTNDSIFPRYRDYGGFNSQLDTFSLEIYLDEDAIAEMNYCFTKTSCLLKVVRSKFEFKLSIISH